jgi:lipoyl(octanoyl) transferase
MHLLGLVDFQACLGLQQRLVYEAGGRNDGQITVLFCEHDSLISVGRQGSRAHINVSPRGLDSQQLMVQWINRGGGCVLHTPGQLAIYPIVPLEQRGWSVGEYVTRLQDAIVTSMVELGIMAQTRPGRHGVWGRSGQLAMLGVAVKGWTTYHGAFINVATSRHPLRLVQTDPAEPAVPSTLLAERQQPVRMTRVRETLVRRLAAALDCDRYHVYSGHPLLPQCRERREPVERAGQVPQPDGMLVAEDGHVHDPGERLHAALRLLLRAQGKDRGASA